VGDVAPGKSQRPPQRSILPKASPWWCSIGWIFPQWKEQALHALLDDLNAAEGPMVCLSKVLGIVGTGDVWEKVRGSLPGAVAAHGGAVLCSGYPRERVNEVVHDLNTNRVLSAPSDQAEVAASKVRSLDEVAHTCI
jgi:hypothetical protein